MDKRFVIPFIFSFLAGILSYTPYHEYLKEAPSPVVSPETKVMVKRIVRKSELWMKYFEMYKKMRENPLLKRRIEAGEYEASNVPLPMIMDLKKTILNNKAYRSGNNINLYIAVQIENPFDRAIKINKVYLKIYNESYIKVQVGEKAYNFHLREEITVFCGSGIINPKEMMVFECTPSILLSNFVYGEEETPLLSFLGEKPDAIIVGGKLFWDLYVNYTVITSSAVYLDIMGHQKYYDLVIRNKILQEKERKSRCTWGPLVGTINILTKSPKNPIWADEDGSLDFTVEVYTKPGEGVVFDKINMKCYVLLIPKEEKIHSIKAEGDTEDVKNVGCRVIRRVFSTTIPYDCPEEFLLSECGIRGIDRDDAMIFGYTLWNDIESNLTKWAYIVVRSGFYEYRADPSKPDEVLRVKVVMKDIGPYEEIVLPIFAHFVYDIVTYLEGETNVE